ncbi:hypothetical protein EDB85DRAFT_2150752 [Lactarius pseudohatsudake]|nr:hypothetical protein EDB85DRAFT_2150752 [Lactarius pseudohatsudake]
MSPGVRSPPTHPRSPWTRRPSLPAATILTGRSELLGSAVLGESLSIGSMEAPPAIPLPIDRALALALALALAAHPSSREGGATAHAHRCPKNLGDLEKINAYLNHFLVPQDELMRLVEDSGGAYKSLLKMYPNDIVCSHSGSHTWDASILACGLHTAARHDTLHHHVRTEPSRGLDGGGQSV